MRIAAEVLAIMSSIDKGKSIQNSVLNVVYILLDNKINVNLSSLIRGSDTTLTNK